MKKYLIRLGYLLLILVCALAVAVFIIGRDHGFFRTPVYETERVSIPEMQQRPAVLVFSKTNAFMHKEAIAAAKTLLQQLADQNGWSVFFSDSGAVFNQADLEKFDVVVWSNVTGSVLTADQRGAFEKYMENGGGFIGLHGAGDGSTGKDWPWYAQLIGANSIGHPMRPQFQMATLKIEDREDPITRHLGVTWERSDEWYSFEESPRKLGFDILAILDESTYSPEAFGRSLRMGTDHPIIWKRCVGRGRAFYSALGHTAETYQEPPYQQLLQNAIAWAARLEGSDCGQAAVAAQEPQQ